jgi:isochorismate synthase
VTATHESNSRPSTHTPDEYAPGDFFFATPERTVFGTGDEQVLIDTDPARLADVVTAAMSTCQIPIAVGVLPFDPLSATGTPGYVTLPSTASIEGPVVDKRPSRSHIGVPLSLRSVPSPETHQSTVAAAITELSSRDLRKVVLARALDLTFAEKVGPERVLRNLLRDNPAAYNFAAGLPGGGTLVGASPELVASRSGKQVISHPHAGSAPRGADPATDRARADALLASRKDQEEHRIVCDMVADKLRPFCRKIEMPSGPSLVATPTMWHLGTTVRGELSDDETTSLHLAAALHPTPAICGAPVDTARELISELEPFPRGYYGGLVGWMDARGDGEWVLAIRCAQVLERSLRLYAGGGIMPNSDPETELNETTAKFQTLLHAIGVEGGSCP